MRVAIIAVLAAGCAADPRIACTTDQQCLAGQSCSNGACVMAMSSPLDAPMTGDGGPDAAPAVCAPSCGAGDYCSGMTCTTCNVDDHCGATCMTCVGSTPHCAGAACVQCTASTQCPVTTPCCVNNACQLLGC